MLLQGGISLQKREGEYRVSKTGSKNFEGGNFRNLNTQPTHNKLSLIHKLFSVIHRALVVYSQFKKVFRHFAEKLTKACAERNRGKNRRKRKIIVTDRDQFWGQ